MFIIDPWMWLVLGGGVWFARRGGVPGPARRALVVAGLYVAVMCAIASLARNAVADEWRILHDAEPLNLMVGPTPITPFRRQVIVDADTHYETGTVAWFPTQVTFDSAVVPRNDNDPDVAKARAAPHIRGFLIWSRFPFWTFEAVSGGTRVSVSDMRFAGRGSPFVQSVVVR